MTTEPRTHEPAGGDGLLFIVALAVVAVVTVEGLFIAYSSYWLMSLVLLLVIAAAIGVSAALVRLIDHGTPLARASREPEPAVEPELAPARRSPAPRPRVVAH